MLKYLKSYNPLLRGFSCLLRLRGEDRINRYLERHYEKLKEIFKNGFDSTLIIIKSNFGKEFAFYMPNSYEEIFNNKYRDYEIISYWINDE